MYKAGGKENGLKTPLWCLYCISLTYLSGKLTYKCMYDGVALHTHNICEIQFKPVFVRLWFIPSILLCGEMLAWGRLSVYFGWVGGRERAPSHTKENTQSSSGASQTPIGFWKFTIMILSDLHF